MKINIEVNDDLLVNAQNISGIEDKSTLIEKALMLFVTIENQKELKNLWGEIELDEGV